MPSRRRPSRRVAPAAVLLLAAATQLVWADRALAGDTPERCVAEAERAQVLREEGRLLESRAEFAACGSESCPAIVRRECLRWLTDVDERSPSIIVSVKTATGADVVGVSVSLDGKALPAASLGRAFSVNPGAHVLRAAHPGFPPIEQQLVVREREKGRVVALVLAKAASEPVEEPRTVPWLSWTLGGVAIVGGAGFGALWASGMDKVSDLRSSCSPYCTAEQIDDVKPTLTAARVSLGVGIGAAVGAVLVYLLQPSRTSAAPSQQAALSPRTRLGPLDPLPATR